jgi:hypothetical protein
VLLAQPGALNLLSETFLSETFFRKAEHGEAQQLCTCFIPGAAMHARQTAATPADVVSLCCHRSSSCAYQGCLTAATKGECSFVAVLAATVRVGN